MSGLWHSSSPSARCLSRYPSSPPPSFTQSPSLPHSLVRDRQASPHRPRLVVSHSTCPPLSPSPHANSFVIGTAVINAQLTTHQCCPTGPAHPQTPKLTHSPQTPRPGRAKTETERQITTPHPTNTSISQIPIPTISHPRKGGLRRLVNAEFFGSLCSHRE